MKIDIPVLLIALLIETVILSPHRTERIGGQEEFAGQETAGNDSSDVSTGKDGSIEKSDNFGDIAFGDDAFAAGTPAPKHTAEERDAPFRREALRSN